MNIRNKERREEDEHMIRWYDMMKIKEKEVEALNCFKWHGIICEEHMKRKDET